MYSGSPDLALKRPSLYASGPFHIVRAVIFFLLLLALQPIPASLLFYADQRPDPRIPFPHPSAVVVTDRCGIFSRAGASSAYTSSGLFGASDGTGEFFPIAGKAHSCLAAQGFSPANVSPCERTSFFCRAPFRSMLASLVTSLLPPFFWLAHGELKCPTVNLPIGLSLAWFLVRRF